MKDGVRIWTPASLRHSWRGGEWRVKGQICASGFRISLRSPFLVLRHREPQTLPSDKLQGIHLIHSPHPANPFLSISPHFASPFPSLVSPFTHNAFLSITASLFGDEDTNNACSGGVIVSEPPPSNCALDFYSEATKNAVVEELGWRRSKRRRSRWWTRRRSGKWEDLQGVQNLRSEGGVRPCAHKVLSALSGYFGNGKPPFLALLQSYGHARVVYLSVHRQTHPS